MGPHTNKPFLHRLQNPSSYLAPAPAAASLRETTVEFRNQRGEKLVGTLLDPPAPPAAAAPAADTTAGSRQQGQDGSSSSSAARPVVLLAHGYMSSRNSELLVRLSTALGRSCGLSSFRFDFSGNGDSEGQFRYGQYR
jgi:hypothetical protein